MIGRAVSVVVLALGVSCGVAYVYRVTHQDSGGKRLAEAAKLEARGAEVEIPEDVKQLVAEAAMLEAANADFRAAAHASETAAPSAAVIKIVKASTGPLQCASPTPRVVTVAAGPSTTDKPLPCLTCVISPGERPEIKVTEAERRTEAGNVLLVGAAEVDVEGVRRFGGPFSAALTEVHELEPATVKTGWPMWALVGVGVAGVLVGGAAVVAVRR